MSLVSVIIPVYNRKEFLLEAIDSVISQTFQDFEIIVVDDGSDLEPRSPFAGSKKVQFFSRPHRGVSSARNFGVSVASGKYIAFLDSDDLWEKKKLEKQIEYLRRNPEFKICYTNEKWMRNGEHLNQHKKHQKYHGWIFEQCLPLCIISCSSILTEKDVLNDLGGFDGSLVVCEDYDLWLRMCLRYPVAFLDEKLIVKRGGHADQLSCKYWGMDRWRIRALKKTLKADLDQRQRELVRRELKTKYHILLAGFWKRKKYWQWLYYKLKSIIVCR